MQPNSPYKTDLDRRPALDRAVLVLNRSWLPVHVTTVRRAICMVYQYIAHVIATDSLQTYRFEDWICLDDPPTSAFITTTYLPIPAPEVVQLQLYNKIPNHEAPFTRQNLYHRDNFTCQYCARRESSAHMSIDHVLPRSKGGMTNWENCVLACVKCNARKADRTLKESGMHLMKLPRCPRWTPYMNLSHRDRLMSWRRFTPKGDWGASLTG